MPPPPPSIRARTVSSTAAQVAHFPTPRRVRLSVVAYSMTHPLSHKVVLHIFFAVPSAGGLILQLPYCPTRNTVFCDCNFQKTCIDFVLSI